MDWSNERYVRLYTRNTIHWVAWPWQARCVLPLLLRAVDRSGRLELGEVSTDGLAPLLLLPLDVFQPGFEALVASGTVQINADVLVVPNFLEAQECAKSDAARQRESRERRRDSAMDQGIDHVTNRDEMSRSVTSGHAVSRAVTPSLPKPTQADPSLPVAPPAREEKPPPAPRRKKPPARHPLRLSDDTGARVWDPRVEAYRRARLDVLHADISFSDAQLDAFAEVFARYPATTPEDVSTRARRAFSDEWWRDKSHPEAFCRQWDKWAVDPTPPQGKSGAAAKFNLTPLKKQPVFTTNTYDLNGNELVRGPDGRLRKKEA